MKKIFTPFHKAVATLLLAFAAVSCSQDSALNSDLGSVDSREPISFNVTTTRGAIITDLTEFSVYAVDDVTGEVVIDHAKFTLQDEVWVTTKDFYWTNNLISFYAYTPTATDANGVTMSKGVVSYAMPSDVTAQPDLMVAQCSASSGNVSLQFARIMAILKFSVSGDSEYPLTSIEVSNIVDDSSYNMATNSWSTTSTTENIYTAGIDKTVTSGLATGTQITDEYGYLMVIPQAASATIVATNSNGDKKTYTLDGTSSWSAGTLYNYTIGIDTIEPSEPEIVWNCCTIDLTDNKYVDDEIIAALESGYNCLKFTGTYYNLYFPYSSSIKYYNYDTGPLRICFADVDGITQFNSSKFDIPQLKEFIFPSELSSLKLVTSAFEDCTMLTTLVNTHSITKFNNGVFRNCTSLESAIFDYVDNDGTTNPNYVFEGCTSLKEVSLASMVTINRYLFTGCTSLESVNLPVAENIYTFAFENCSSLKVLKLPKAYKFETNKTNSTTTTDDDGRQFSGCDSLTELWLTSDEEIGGTTSGTSSNSYDYLSHMIFEGLNTENCTLYLKSINFVKAIDNVWGGSTWKDVVLVEE